MWMADKHRELDCVAGTYTSSVRHKHELPHVFGFSPGSTWQRGTDGLESLE